LPISDWKITNLKPTHQIANIATVIASLKSAAISFFMGLLRRFLPTDRQALLAMTTFFERSRSSFQSAI
jgi:hypothetical protein